MKEKLNAKEDRSRISISIYFKFLKEGDQKNERESIFKEIMAENVPEH